MLGNIRVQKSASRNTNVRQYSCSKKCFEGHKDTMFFYVALLNHLAAVSGLANKLVCLFVACNIKQVQDLLLIVGSRYQLEGRFGSISLTMAFLFLFLVFMVGHGAGIDRGFRGSKGFSNRLFTSSGMGSSRISC